MGIVEEDKKYSGIKMEEVKDLKTLECLRGRLLAERQASKLAKQNSDLMNYKLAELEKMLKQEIKLKNKAEKKLRFLKKKLESLNVSSSSVESSDQSSTSEKSEISFSSSSRTRDSASEVNEFELGVTNSVTSMASNHSKPSSTTVYSDDDDHHPKFDDDHDDNNRCSEPMNLTNYEDNYAGDSLAIVPVISPESCRDTKTEITELKPVHENVAQVLDTLRFIKEKIQSSMEMRQMVRVGPI